MKSASDRLPSILIVDDEESIRTLLVHALEMSEDYRLHQAGDGLEAQDILRSEEIDLVITDLSMPRMGGMTLMQWAQEECPGAVWLILSGKGTFQDAVRAVHLGAFDYITKPMRSIDSFLVTVRNALRQKLLETERLGLLRDIEERNVQLAQQVTQLQQACRLLRKQADVIQEDLRRAELIQRALLPRVVPDVENLSVDTIYRPSQNVGGDLYDIVRLDDRHLVAYVADAAGHGVSAAMLAVLFKHRIPLTIGLPPKPTRPAEVFECVNRALVDECKAPGLFVTAAYCLLDTQTHELQFASAGHPAPLVQRASGELQRLDPTGPALGLSREASFSQCSLKLEAGDRLLLYTDGLLETASQESSIEETAMGGILAQPDRNGSDALYDLLDLAARRRHGGQEDDITLLLLGTDGSPSAVDNGAPQSGQKQAPVSAGHATVSVGTDEAGTMVRLEGRANWMNCAPFHDRCLSELDQHHALTLDLSSCGYLDSTFLGTIQELVEKAEQLNVPLKIQGIHEEVSDLFSELGMNRVIDHFASDGGRSMPADMSPVSRAAPQAGDGSEMRILRAHEALASLSDENRKEFSALIDRLREELGQCPTT